MSPLLVNIILDLMAIGVWVHVMEVAWPNRITLYVFSGGVVGANLGLLHAHLNAAGL